MDNFFSTLTQTTAALIAILLAAVGAYYIFLQSKAAEYDDKVQAEQVGIREDLADLQARWPPSITMFIPPEFKDSFSSRTGNSYGPQLVNKLATSFLFPSPEVSAALADSKPYDSFGTDHWQGRVYSLALDEAMKVMSGRAVLAQTAFAMGQPELKPQASAAFPSSPVGPGFDEWRSDFDQISIADHFLEPYSEFAVTDFRAFLDLHRYPNNNLQLDLYTKGVHSFHDSIRSIRTRVKNIDDLKLARSRYSFGGRVKGVPILVMVLLATMTGVAIPLFFMASGAKLTPTTAIGVLIASLTFTICAFLQFGWDVFRPLRGDPKLYVADRWLRPIVEDLDRFIPQTESGATVSITRVAELLDSGPRKELPTETIDALSRYRSIALSYNKCASDLDAKVIVNFQSNKGMQRFIKKYTEINRVQRQYSVIHPGDAVNQKRMEQILSGVRQGKDARIAVETATYWGSRGKLALIAAPEEKDAFMAAISLALHDASETEEAKVFLKSKAELFAASSRLRELLAQFLRQ